MNSPNFWREILKEEGKKTQNTIAEFYKAELERKKK